MLVLDDIHAHYGSAHVLHGVRFDMQAGQVACLVGRNGAGKSTTLKAVMGVVPLSSGSILFNGDRIDGRSASPRCGMRPRLGSGGPSGIRFAISRGKHSGCRTSYSSSGFGKTREGGTGILSRIWCRAAAVSQGT